MEPIFDLLETILFTNVLGEINLYTILATGLKFLFVILVLRFIYTIVKMITLDIRSNWQKEVPRAPHLQLLSSPESFDFPVQAEYYLSDNTTIGRADDNSIVLKDSRVSKHHARIVRDTDFYYIDDLGATNPTYVNNQPLEGPVQLESEDQIRIGGLLFRFVDAEVA